MTIVHSRNLQTIGALSRLLNPECFGGDQAHYEGIPYPAVPTHFLALYGLLAWSGLCRLLGMNEWLYSLDPYCEDTQSLEYCSPEFLSFQPVAHSSELASSIGFVPSTVRIMLCAS